MEATDSRDGSYRDVVRKIDLSITSMASLMLKLVGARIGLGVEHMRSSVPNYPLMLSGQQDLNAGETLTDGLLVRVLLMVYEAQLGFCC